MSRGAGSCLFVEQDKAAIDSIRANGDRLGIKPDIRSASVLSLGKAHAPLDLIFMDAPYGTGAGAVALDKLSRFGWTGAASWISIETDRTENIDVKGFVVDAVRDVGKARLTILRVET